MQFVAVSADRRQIPVNLGFDYTADLESDSVKICCECGKLSYKFIDSNSVVRCWICFAKQVGPYNCDECGATGILIRDLHDCERDTIGYNPSKRFRVIDAGKIQVLDKVEHLFNIVRMHDSKFMEGFSSTNPALAFRSATEVCKRDYN